MPPAPPAPPSPPAPAPAPAPPEMTQEQLEASAWAQATATVEKLAQLIAPLSRAGLSSSDALEAANAAIGEAKIALKAKIRAADDPPQRVAPTRLSGLARNYGATILDVD